MKRLPPLLSIVKLDFDNEPPSEDLLWQLLDRAGYTLLEAQTYRSPGGKGWHYYLTLDPAPRTPFEVIAIQAMLGSDPFREAMNLRRARKFWCTPKFAESWFNVLYQRRR